MKSIIKLAALFVVLFTCSAAYADPIFARPIDRSHLRRPAIPIVDEVLVEIDIVEEALYGEVMDGMTCEEYMGYVAGGLLLEQDTDQDGIADIYEMSVVRRGVRFGEAGFLRHEWVFDPASAGCTCGDDTLTCWYVADTDHDGIIDSRDGDYWQVIDSQLSDLDGTEPITERIVRLRDDDGDGKPAVRDNDSDGDNIRDGTEDRSVFFDRYADSYLGTSAIDYFAWYPNSSERTPCELDSFDRPIGVSHRIYEIRSSFAPPRRLGLSCINETVADSTSFNGEFDYDYDVSNYLDVDTDDDGFCDGDGPACEGLIPNDHCPTEVASPGSTDGC